MTTNSGLPSTIDMAKSIWWRLTWRQTIFSVLTLLTLYAIDGYHLIIFLMSHKHRDLLGLVAESALDGIIYIALFSFYSIYILKRKVWEKPINKSKKESTISFFGSKNKSQLTTMEAMIVFFALLWRAWIINGVLLSLLWWIPGFFIVSYLVAKFFAIWWYIRYPMGNIKIVANKA